MEEIWKDIPEYEGKYQVSNMGRVKSLKRYDSMGRKREEKILQLNNSNRYLSIMFSSEGVKETIFVHRLVAKTFPEVCGEWFDGCVIDHINTNCKDNRACNLRICTQKENCNNPLTLISKVGAGKKSWDSPEKRKRQLEGNKKTAQKNKIPILEYRPNGEIIKWDSASDAGRAIGVNKTNICSCLKGKTKTCNGSRWAYAA